MRPASPAKREPAGRPKRPVHDAHTTHLLNEYTPLVHKIASGFQRRLPRNVLREDLVAAGMIGLIEAADRYDETRQEPFLAFAEHRIRGAVLDELRRRIQRDPASLIFAQLAEEHRRAVVVRHPAQP